MERNDSQLWRSFTSPTCLHDCCVMAASSPLVAIS
ncbi:hypothetical protein [Caudoviricetes sp.]|nr:hypothetical protein [Caudoviricetes sp.]